MHYLVRGIFLAFLVISTSIPKASSGSKKAKLSQAPLHKQEAASQEVLTSVRTARKRDVVDRVLATIYHTEGIVLVCESDLREGLSGQVPSLRDAIIKELIILDGKVLTKAKMLTMGSMEDEVEKALSRAQEQLSMTRAELTAFFKERGGLTLEEAKKELERSLIVENVIDARVKSKANVSQGAIEQYHKDNPIVMYTLKKGQVPLGASSKALTKALIQRDIASGEIEKSVQWIDLGAIPEKDFSAEKAYIKNLSVGSIVISDESDEDFTLLKLVSKKEIPLEERKSDIANKLTQERYIQTQKEYFGTLLKDANIRYSVEQTAG